MTYNSSFNQSSHLNNVNEEIDNQECKTTNDIYEAITGEGIDYNLQTPLMYSQCSTLDFLTGFEQHSIQNDHNSVINELRSKTSRPLSPTGFRKNHTLEIPCKVYSSHKINNAQEKFLSGNTFAERDTNPCERISIYTNISFQYDVAFKKPHFLKHSVFEDDLAAFKDESSPNLLSTAASSLSSLTIDDDDYNDNSLQNKAGLVKKKINSMNILQNIHYQEHCRHDPVGSASEPEQIPKADIERVVNQLDQKFIYSDKKCCTETNFNKGSLICKDPKIAWNLKNNQYSRNLQDISLEKDSKSIKNESHCHVPKKNKFVNTLKNNKESSTYHKIQSKDEHNDKHSKDDLYEKYRNEKLEFKEKRKVFENCYKSSNNELSNYIEENNDLIAYEEQLLDQCIRRGMAKVTKQKITDIKPFCWDLNHICLTTRTMLKNHAERIIKDRKDEQSNHQISRKCLQIGLDTNSRTK